MFKRFKTPIIASGLILVLTIIVGLGTIAIIYNSDGTNRQKAKRAELAGTGVATAGCIAIAPFWLYAAFKIGQAKRARQNR